MTVADDAAAELRERSGRARPFRIAAVIMYALALGLGLGIVRGLVIAVLTAAGLPVVLAADRYRLNRKLADGQVARAYARVPGSSGSGSRWTGVLTVSSDGLRWTPLRRFRRRGAADFFLPWQDLKHASAARLTPSWLSWMIRNDVVAFEWLGGCLPLSVTSPQVIYAGLRETGHNIAM